MFKVQECIRTKFECDDRIRSAAKPRWWWVEAAVLVLMMVLMVAVIG